MGYMLVMGTCVACGRTFTFNAERVPSAVIYGRREPICRECVDRINPIRVEHGFPPIEVLPDAYEAQEID